jgi:phosphatidylserine/phosphatidylglycerophosphate/cardiolipin synthase-like enzyme
VESFSLKSKKMWAASIFCWILPAFVFERHGIFFGLDPTAGIGRMNPPDEYRHRPTLVTTYLENAVSHPRQNRHCQMQERLLLDRLFNFRHAWWCLLFLSRLQRTHHNMITGVPDSCKKIPRQIRSSTILATDVLNPSAVSILTSTKACDPNNLTGMYSLDAQDIGT